MDLVIGVVGKPNVGKSSFLNAATNAKAEVGDRPFVTIEPNIGVSYFSTPCACARFKKQDQCRPRHGSCDQGVRKIPVKLLDVAGLVPGASKGLGLGNKFLDDLRQAHVLLHIIDVSGTTNEKGERTSGYDPSRDAIWLKSEIEEWVFGNLFPRWSTVARRHSMAKRTLQQTLQQQWGGYGARGFLVAKVIARLDLRDPCDLREWDEHMVRRLVRVFVAERFRTIHVLNKVDKKESEKWLLTMTEMPWLEEERKEAERDGVRWEAHQKDAVLCSSGAESLLQKWVREGKIRYRSGEGDCEEEGAVAMDAKEKQQLNQIRDMILFRFGSTGVRQAVDAGVGAADIVPVWQVRSVVNFSSIASEVEEGCFRDVQIVRRGTTFAELAETLSGRELEYIDCAQTGQRVAEDTVITQDNNVCRFVFKDKDRKKIVDDD